jgi:starvation-inducible DNA-binding protein
MQMKQPVWNVKGPNRIGLHELIDKVAQAARSHLDQMGERIVQLSVLANGTACLAVSRTRLTENSPEISKRTAAVHDIAHSLSRSGHDGRNSTSAADDLDDADTADSFAGAPHGINKCGLSKFKPSQSNN